MEKSIVCAWFTVVSFLIPLRATSRVLSVLFFYSWSAIDCFHSSNATRIDLRFAFHSATLLPVSTCAGFLGLFGSTSFLEVVFLDLEAGAIWTTWAVWYLVSSARTAESSSINLRFCWVSARMVWAAVASICTRFTVVSFLIPLRATARVLLVLIKSVYLVSIIGFACPR